MATKSDKGKKITPKAEPPAKKATGKNLLKSKKDDDDDDDDDDFDEEDQAPVKKGKACI